MPYYVPDRWYKLEAEEQQKLDQAYQFNNYSCNFLIKIIGLGGQVILKKDDRVKVTRLMKPNKTNKAADSLNRNETDNIKDYDRAWEDDRL